METENLSSLSISELIERFEKDIRFGCHSTLAEASHSQAGKELRRREGVTSKLLSHWKEMGERSLDGTEASVRVGIGFLIQWLDQE